MSTTIDNKVVEMKFDNADFEKNVQTSLNTLHNLKKGLNLTESAKSLQGISDVAKSFSLHGIDSAVETIAGRFTNLGIIGVTALQNITNSALEAGKRMLSALTIDPIKTGLSEYETQIGAIQTILANTSSKGTTLDQVNAALDELNTYSDKTIYNFTEMARNIGTFTAAGVDLKTSTAAIKGIANLAAVSGSNSQQASTAMYQLSQALASGTVKLMDWNSVVNAGMGGAVFQDALKETARVHGIAIDKMIKNDGSFRETLQNGWLTSDILTETLSKFTGDLNEAQLTEMGYTKEQIKEIMKMGVTASDAATKVKTFTQLVDTLKEAAQSGWSQSWEFIVGDFEDAKTLWTDVSNELGALIGKQAEERNKMLEAWSKGGGRDAILKSFTNVWTGVLSVIKPAQEAFREIFPKTTAAQLIKISKAIQDMTSKFKMGAEDAANLKSTFKGLFSVLDIAGQAIGAIVKALFPTVSLTGSLISNVLKLTGSFGAWLTRLDETIKKTDFFNKVFTTMSTAISEGLKKAQEVISITLEKLNEFGNWAGEKFNFNPIKAFSDFLGLVHNRMQMVTQTSETLRTALSEAFAAVAGSAAFATITTGLDKIVTFFKSIWSGLKILGAGIAKVASGFTEGFQDAIGNADFNAIFDIVNGGLLAGLLVGIDRFVNNLSKPLKSASGFIDSMASIFNGLTGSLEAMQSNLKSKTLLTIASAVGILAASLLVLSLIDSEKLTSSLAAITGLFVDLMGSMAVFSKIAGGGTKGLTVLVGAMVGMSIAVLILASAMKKLASLEWDDVGKGLVSIAGLTTVLVAAAAVMSKTSGPMTRGAFGLILLSFALKNLVGVVEDLGAMDTGSLTKGLVGVGVLVTELAAFMVAAKFGSMGVSTGLGLLALSGAIVVLASSVETFGYMNTEALIKGLVAMGAMLAELSLFIAANQGSKGMISTAIGMVILGGAMKILASAISDLGYMSAESLIKGIASLGAALGIVTLALNLMPPNMIGIGLGLIAVSTALVIMTSALTTLGAMSWEGIAKGFVALASGLGVIALAVNLMTGALGGAAALLIIAGALAIFAPTLVLLSTMSWMEIAKGLTALAGAFAVIGIAGFVLAPLTPVIIALAGAFALIGVGIAAAGAGLLAMGLGLTALAAGFAALATLGSAGAIAVVAALTIIIEGVASMIPFLLIKIGEGIVGVIEMIAAATPQIVAAITTIVVALVAALVTLIPIIVDGAFKLLVAVLDMIVKYAPTIVEAVVNIIAGILTGIANALPNLIQAGVDVMVAFINGVASASVQLVDAAFNAMVTFLNGLAESINTNAPILMDAVNNLMMALLNAAFLVLTNSFVQFKEIGSRIINSGLIQGIKDKFEAAKTTVFELCTGLINKIKESVTGFKEAAGYVIQGFIQGIKDKFQDAINAASELGHAILNSAKSALGINSPSKEFAEVGKWSVLGVVQGLKDYAGYAMTAAAEVGTGAVNSLQNSIGNLSDIINGNISLDPIIKPTLDLSNVMNGAKEINSLFNNRQVALTGASYQNGGSGINGSTTVQFTQNNYSPKALSRIEIYRQTKNQINEIREVLV